VNFDGRGQLNFMRIVEHLLPVPGDFNGDRYVDSADYSAWQAQYGMVGSGLAADGNNDGVVDGSDYLIWRKAIAAITPGPGSGSGAGNFTASVPEPGTCLLAAFALIGLIVKSVRWRP
jgi:hypothetical protein